MSVSSRGWVYSSASSAGSSTRHVVLEVERRAPGTGGPGAGRSRPGARRGTTRDESTVPTSRPSAVDELELDRRAGAQADPRCRRRRGRPSTSRPPRGLSWSSSTSSRTASSRPSPNQRSSSGVSGSSCAAHASCARARTGCRGSRPPPRPGGRAARSGGAAYHWSSWSSPATSTAAARRLRAPGPARPAAASTRACPGSR